MNKLLIIVLLALLGMTQAVALEYEYVPFVREGVKWVYYISDYGTNPNLPKGVFNLEFKGDTVINGKTYKAMHKYYGEAINQENDTVPIYMREEDKVVYGIIPDGQEYSDCLIGHDYIPHDMYNGNEFVMYDFNDPVGFLREFKINYPGDPYYYYEYNNTDTIALGNHFVKRYNGTWSGNEFVLVEGVGVDSVIPGYTLYFAMGTNLYSSYFSFSHLIENGEIIYKGMRYREGAVDGIDEVVANKTRRPLDPNYYNLTGQPVGKEVPTTPGIYIHQGKKIVVR